MGPRTVGILYQPLGHPSPTNLYRGHLARMVGAVHTMGMQAIVMVPPQTPDAALPQAGETVVALSTPFTQTAAVVEAVGTAHRRHGFHYLFPFQECTVSVGAYSCETHDIPGVRPSIAQRFRDKWVMAQAVKALGIVAPRTVLVRTSAEAEAFANTHGWPIILKPRDAAGAEGVIKMDSAEQLATAWEAIAVPRGVIAQEFIAGDEYHVDSIVRSGQILFAVASRYFRPLLHFHEHPPGSVTRLHQRTPGEEAMLVANAAVLSGLGLIDGIAHVEFFLRNDRPVFGEAAARVGGGHAVPTVEAATGVHLAEAWARAVLDPTYQIVPSINGHEVGGQLLPAAADGVIEAVVSPETLTGGSSQLQDATFWYRVGDHLHAATRSTRMFGYLLGSGPTAAEVTTLLQEALARFWVRTRRETVA
ncbi:MAG: ATP-grasp domain-containing protein [Deltaproteobacteria bacterium]|nr:ATP-grasp domain-containing protein [Deltaproteobacteria bacterium]